MWYGGGMGMNEPAKMPKVAEFVFVRATKNTYRYEEEAEVPIVGVIYVQKHAVPTKPQRIRVTIEELHKGGDHT